RRAERRDDRRDRRGHADAHRRGAEDVRGAGGAEDQHPDDQHQRGAAERGGRSRPRRGGARLPARGVRAGLSGAYFALPASKSVTSSKKSCTSSSFSGLTKKNRSSTL